MMLFAAMDFWQAVSGTRTITGTLSGMRYMMFDSCFSDMDLLMLGVVCGLDGMGVCSGMLLMSPLGLRSRLRSAAPSRFSLGRNMLGCCLLSVAVRISRHRVAPLVQHLSRRPTIRRAGS